MELSVNQQRYLFADISGKHDYFIGVWYRIDGNLNPRRLKSAVTQALQRHESCRTVFRHGADGKFHPHILNRPAFQFRRCDISDIEAGSVETAARACLPHGPRFDRLGELHHVLLLCAPQGSQALVFAQHHAVSDGRSLDLLISEIAAIYNGTTHRLPLPTQYSQLAPPEDPTLTPYWAQKFEGLAEAPHLHRRHRPTQPQPRRLSLPLPESLTQELHDISEFTPFSIFAATYAIQIWRLTGQIDTVFSIQSSGRFGFEKAHALGPFSNALPIRLLVDLTAPFRTLAKQAHEQIREALRHERLGYPHILRTANIQPDFSLNLYPDTTPPQFQGSQTGIRNFLPSESEYTVNLRWHRGLRGNYHLECHYDGAVISSDRATMITRRALRLVADALRSPDQQVGTLAKATQLVPQTTPDPLPSLEPLRIYTLVEQAARDHPQHTAIRMGETSLSYDTLMQQVEQRAGLLYQAGIKAGQRTAFLAQRNIDFIITILALSRIGATFAAFDRQLPPTRLRQQAESLGITQVLCCDPTAGFADPCDLNIRYIDTVAPPPTAAPPPPPADGETPAYFLFTSGTTGRPKCIGVGHGALHNFLRWQAARFTIGAGDRVSLLSGLAHDPVLRDIFLPLSLGAELTIPPALALKDPRRLHEWLREARPSVVHTTPATGQMLSATQTTKLPGCRIIFWGGDRLPAPLVESFSRTNPRLQQVNLYGTSETPQAVAFEICNPHEATGLITVPVGQAIEGVNISVIDAKGESCDIGEIGEVQVRTPYQVWVDGKALPGDMFASQIYQTGDLGYLLPDGRLQLIGRNDDQIILNGHRIEPGEIEHHLLNQPGVTAACVLARHDGSGLLAHVAARSSPFLTDEILRHALARVLPAHLVPGHIILHEHLPHLPNGKLDRQKLLHLPAPAADRSPENTLHKLTAAEQDIARIYARVLGRPVPRADQSFVTLGADSLNAIQAMLQLDPLIQALPENWQQLPISKLARLQRKPRASGHNSVLTEFFRPARVEISSLLRALAILAVVALHFKVFSIGGGATTLLFLLAGHSMMRFQIPKILGERTIAPILILVAKIAALSLPITLILSLAKFAQGEPFLAANVLFYANFLDYSLPGAEGRAIWLWFIACYVQIMLILALLLSWDQLRQALRQHPARSLVWAFIAAATLRFALPAIADPSLLRDGVPVFSHWNYLPSTHLPTVLLGALVFQARAGIIERGLCLGITIAYGGAVALVFSHNGPELMVASVALLIWVNSLPLIRGAYWPIMAISQSSLYLYLLHNPMLSVLNLTGLSLPGPALMLLAILLALGFGQLWERLLQRLYRP